MTVRSVSTGEFQAQRVQAALGASLCSRWKPPVRTLPELDAGAGAASARERGREELVGGALAPIPPVPPIPLDAKVPEKLGKPDPELSVSQAASF